MVKQLMKQVIKVKKIFSWIVMLELVVNENIFSVISIYGPHCGGSDKKKNAVYDELNAVVRAKSGKCNITEDFNRHVGSSADGFVRVHAGYGRWKEFQMVNDFLNLLTALL